MANMFDVSTTMSEVAEQQAQEMNDLMIQVDTISDKVDRIKIDFDNSMIAIDDSIETIMNTTDRIMSVSQSAIEEQQIQKQILESEQEVEALKGDQKRNSPKDLTRLLKSMEDTIKLMQFNVEKLLEENSKNKSDIPDIGSSARKALGVALGTIFGASVLGYLFSDEENPGETEQKTEESTESNQIAEQAAQSQEVTQEPQNTVEELPTQEPPKPEEEEQVQKVEPVEDMAGEKKLTQQTTDQKMTPGQLYDKAVTSKELVKKDGVFYYPDGVVLGLDDSNYQAEIIEKGGELYESWAADSSRDILIKDHPEFFEGRKPVVEAKQASNGQQLNESNKNIEVAQYTARNNIAQNVITVINQPDPVPETKKTKTPTVIGKVTYEQIVG